MACWNSPATKDVSVHDRDKFISLLQNCDQYSARLSNSYIVQLQHITYSKGRRDVKHHFIHLSCHPSILSWSVYSDRKWLTLSGGPVTCRVNQQPPMHQLAVLSTGWVAFFHSAPDGVHHNWFLFVANHCTFFFFFFFCSWPFFLDLTSHIATLLTFLPS
jgi:hypothetical protein